MKDGGRLDAGVVLQVRHPVAVQVDAAPVAVNSHDAAGCAVAVPFVEELVDARRGVFRLQQGRLLREGRQGIQDQQRREPPHRSAPSPFSNLHFDHGFRPDVNLRLA